MVAGAAACAPAAAGRMPVSASSVTPSDSSRAAQHVAVGPPRVSTSEPSAAQASEGQRAGTPRCRSSPCAPVRRPRRPVPAPGRVVGASSPAPARSAGSSGVRLVPRVEDVAVRRQLAGLVDGTRRAPGRRRPGEGGEGDEHRLVGTPRRRRRHPSRRRRRRVAAVVGGRRAGSARRPGIRRAPAGRAPRRTRRPTTPRAPSRACASAAAGRGRTTEPGPTSRSSCRRLAALATQLASTRADSSMRSPRVGESVSS